MKKLEGFSTFTHEHEGISHLVYQGGDGPGLLVIHELPGMTEECVAFARRLMRDGFRVYMPLMFGAAAVKQGGLRTLGYIGRLCISREFYLFSKQKTSPILPWLRSLCRKAHAECGGPGVGAIGMCLTGGFAIPLMVEPSLMAPVLSQPSLPVGMGQANKSNLGCSREDLAIARQRAGNGVPIRGFRFSEDFMAPQDRFDRLKEEFGDAFIPLVIDSSPGNPHQISKRAHAVFTTDFVDQEGHPTREAYDLLIAFFRERLGA